MIHFENLIPLASLCCAASTTLTFAPLPSTVRAAGETNSTGICARTAFAVRMATLHDLYDDFYLHFATCLNLTDAAERDKCMAAAAEDYVEGLALAEEQFAARLELCGRLGGEAYDPDVEPEDFSTIIDNPYLPLIPGTTWTYQQIDGEELELIVVAVTDETREIAGVECVAVRDTVEVDGEVVEDTIDYYAQDEDGNVWYFGEISMNFEDGYLVDLDGSWEAGVEGGKPGIVMLAAPGTGDTYRQEMALGEAEDAASILATDAAVSVPYGSFVGCLQTLDFTPIEPAALEHKFYAPGVGVVLEVDPLTGVRLELVDLQTP